MTTNQTQTVVGLFDDYATAERVVGELTRNGFDRQSIDVTASDRGATRTTAERRNDDPDDGAMARFFRNLFGTNDEYDTYTEAVNRGGVVVSVTADESRLDRAVDIMNSDGAVDIDHRRESWGNTAIGTPSRTDTTTNTTAAKAANTSGAMSDRTIPVVKEELQVGKRSVSRGGVRVISRIVEQPVQEEVTLREERVKVDRRPANRAATEQDLRRRDEVIEVRETVEEPVVGKRSRVVEEVVVSKETAQRQETVRDTVRRSDVSVERLGPEGGAETDYNAEFRRDFQSRYGSNKALQYETYAPAYEYGYRMASHDQYRGRKWDDIEPTLRSDYERTYPHSTWQEIKDAVRYGWDRVTGRR